jgi:amidohydrolase
MLRIRRAIHQRPELSNQEFETSALVHRELEAAGITDIIKVVATGLIARIQGEGGGKAKTLAIRADLDALPMTELSGLPFASKNPGVMHACGHDAHTAIVLAAALALHRRRDTFSGTVQFIFQPAEEAEPLGGRTLVQEGHLNDVDGIIGIHVDPLIESGVIGVRAGAFACSADEFDIQILGKSAHGGKPHEGVDAITVAAGVIQELQKVPARQKDPAIPLVITIGSIQGGTARNIIADTVTMKGTVRTMSEDVRALAHKRIRDLSVNLARAHGADAKVEITTGEPVLVNDDAMTDLIREAAKDVMGPEKVFSAEPWTAADDFAFYCEVKPSVYFRLGVGNRGKGIDRGLHQPDFVVDEAALPIGAAVLIRAAQRFLNGQDS